ncbi:hypothetical protein LOD99_2061 [Oopsacas minuta]|uniref:Uncharacterized protein n=1 Tax=Oopsacas minuta TaxID=111878 RepID=A0AAV7K2U7_9METZ|nr:hypothetical protein LOD99_2061 [Oopsacas minuta]
MLRTIKDKLKKTSEYNPHPPLPIVFNTGLYNTGLALNRERNIFLVYGSCTHNACCYCYIFTVEGEFMTRVYLGFNVRNLPKLHAPPFVSFTDERILLEIDGNRVREIYDLRVNLICFEGTILDVDKDGNYYIIPHYPSEIIVFSPFGIQLYSTTLSFEYLGNEKFFVTNKYFFILNFCWRRQNNYLSLKLQGHTTQLNIHQYSRTTGNLLETATYLIPPRFNRCSIDQSNNVVIDFHMSNEYCVCYSDGRVADYKFEDEIKDGTITSEDFLITENLQLIRIFEREYFSRMQLLKHRSECELEEISCPYTDYGCKAGTMLRRDLLAHKKEFYKEHQDMSLTKLNDEIEQLREENVPLKKKQTEMEWETKTMKKI